MKYSGDEKWFFIPVETATRELQSKLLLSLFLVEYGFKVVIGGRFFLENKMHRFPLGVYLLHSFDKSRYRISNILKHLGHKILAWDDGGLVWVNEKDYVSRRIYLPTVENIDAIFAWGDEHESVLKTVVEEGKILSIGNPRIDLLYDCFLKAHKKRANMISSRFGEHIILVATSFGWLNYDLYTQEGGEKNSLEYALKKSGYSEEWVQSQYQLFLNIQEMVRILSSTFPDKKIIVRPHPAESDRVWKKIENERPNVLCVRDDDHLAWLLAAEHFIHTGGTMALEYAALGRVPLYFDPARDSINWQQRQPMAVSHIINDMNELISIVRGEGVKVEKVKKISQIIKLPASIDELSARKIAEFSASIAPVPRVPGFLGMLLSFSRSMEKRVFKLKKKKFEFYIKRKFPLYKEEYLESIIRSFISECSLQINIPRIKKIYEYIYLIEKS